MTKFTSRDLKFSVVTGLITGLIFWRIFDFLNISFLGFGAAGHSWAWLVLAGPIIYIFGTWLGYFLGQWLKFFDQFGKFAVIGFTNTSVDFGILNLLIAFTGYVNGAGYAWIKVAAFVAALLSSYVLNKFWTFHGLGGGQGEFVKFVVVTISSFLVNLLVSWAVATYVTALFGATPDQWANIANVCGVAVGLIVNFLGFKFAVFKK